MQMEERKLDVPGYENILEFKESKSGLHAIIAVHSTTLGPGLGGTRIYPYATFDEALTDVLRLSKGMTYKAAMAQVGIGGAKSVILADPNRDKTPALLHAFAESVNRMNGLYICAEDVGCNVDDVLEILKHTPYVCGVCNLRGSGDPSAFTARGTYQGIRSAFKKLDHSPNLKGKRIAIQGVGGVGSKLLEMLFWDGVELLISDLNTPLLERLSHKFSATILPPDQILQAECDLVAPCAMGGGFNADSIPKLRCRAVVGAANNQLLHLTDDAQRLQERGILYAPDFITNSGGLINVVNELSSGGYHAQRALEHTDQIYDQLLKIYTLSQEKGISTQQAACDIVHYRLEHKIGKRTEPLLLDPRRQKPTLEAYV